MAFTIDKCEIIKYPPEALKAFICRQYEYIDNLHFILNPQECLENPKEYIKIAKKRFKAAGWEGDGEVGLIWVPPFMLKDENGEMIWMFGKTEGEIVWHVKQLNDGTSWLLLPEDLDKQLIF